MKRKMKKIYFHSLNWNEGQLPPAERKTSSEGNSRVFIEKTAHE